jgi:hypothetical protein
MADFLIPRFWKYWTQKSLKSESNVIMDKYAEETSVVQQVHRVLSDTEKLAGSTPAEVVESSESTSIVASAEKRENFCKGLDAKLMRCL